MSKKQQQQQKNPAAKRASLGVHPTEITLTIREIFMNSFQQKNWNKNQS